MTDDPGNYFLSYSRSDERFALRLAQDLRANGVHMWVDQLDIRPSEHWDRAIERAVRECRGIVVILSPRSVASDNVADEISYAIDSGKSVLPVMIEKCVLPLRITRMHLIDATADYDKALRQCLSELTRESDAAPEPSRAAAGTSKPVDAATVGTAKRQLIPIVGPIGNVLADKAAERANSPEEFYARLAQHIDNEADRKRFLAYGATSGGAPAHSPIAEKALNTIAFPVSEVDALAAALIPFLGPIAPLVAKQESRCCASLDDLRQRLAERIPSDAERARFLELAFNRQ